MENADLNKIRHFKGSVADFKNYFDQRAGENTNAFGTPDYQGFNNVHATRGANKSPHWDDVQEANKDITNVRVGDLISNDKTGERLKVLDVHGHYSGKVTKVTAEDRSGKRKVVNIIHYSIVENEVNEEIDREVGHTDDEPDMIADDLRIIERYARELRELIESETKGETDFPHWWQSKIVLAKEYLVKAKHYLRGELEKDSPNQAVPTFENYKHKG